MGFWILVLLCLGAAVALLGYGTRRARPLSSGAADLALYRDQLKEIDRDRARGLLNEAEAERSRLEVSRRLLAADRALASEAKVATGPARLAVMLAGLVLAGSVLGYAWLGQPGLPDQPRAGRIEAAAAAKASRPGQEAMEAETPVWTPPEGADPNYLKLIEQLREAVVRFPEEMQGWQYLVQHETALGNVKSAWRAQRALLDLRAKAGQPVGDEDLALLGSLMTQAAGGRISPEAEAVFTQALQVNPENGTALFHAGLLYLQTGRPDRTFDIWAPLLARSDAEAPWTEPLRNLLPAVAALAGQRRYELPPLPQAKPRGPSAEDVEAAAALPEGERAAMIEGMVEGLAARLASEGGPATDWAKLIRALGVLGQTERAAAIYAEAQGVFAGRSADLAEIRAAAEAAGLARD